MTKRDALLSWMKEIGDRGGRRHGHGAAPAGHPEDPLPGGGQPQPGGPRLRPPPRVRPRRRPHPHHQHLQGQPARTWPTSTSRGACRDINARGRGDRPARGPRRARLGGRLHRAPQGHAQALRRHGGGGGARHLPRAGLRPGRRGPRPLHPRDPAVGPRGGLLHRRLQGGGARHPHPRLPHLQPGRPDLLRRLPRGGLPAPRRAGRRRGGHQLLLGARRHPAPRGGGLPERGPPPRGHAQRRVPHGGGRPAPLPVQPRVRGGLRASATRTWA